LHLKSCLAHLNDFRVKLEGDDDIVLAAEDLRMAANELGKITGRINTEEVLDALFKDFCIGK
jgi:tRNA modification GTPase